MWSSKLASVAALFGGAAWILDVLRSDLQMHDALYYVGVGGLLLGLAGMGYALVSTAPMWLRAVVSAANTVFGYLVWTMVRGALGSSPSMLVGGVVLVAVALVGFARGHKVEDPAPTGSHRAAH